MYPVPIATIMTILVCKRLLNVSSDEECHDFLTNVIKDHDTITQDIVHDFFQYILKNSTQEGLEEDE